MLKYKYVIWSPGFNINSGGILCLHYLCHLLNEIKHDAYIYYKNKENTKYNNYGLNIKIWPNHHVDDNTIVIYPEIVDHNPLNAKNIVRWLLHKPGFWTGRVNFGEKDLIVGYGEETSSKKFIINKQNILKIEYIMNDVYYNKNMSREHTCYSIRKSRKKSHDQHPKNSICIDNKSHSEINEIFNMSHTFINYDPYSYFSTYAVLCGCESIVIPDNGLSKEEWKPDITNRYGIAYGFDDLEYARATKYLLFTKIANQHNTNIEMVKNFTELCKGYFI